MLFDERVGLALVAHDLHRLVELRLRDPVVAGPGAAAALTGGLTLDHDVADAAEQDAQGDDRGDRDQAGLAELAAPLGTLVLQEPVVERAEALERRLRHDTEERRWSAAPPGRRAAERSPPAPAPATVAPRLSGRPRLRTLVRLAVAACVPDGDIELPLSPRK